MFFSQITHAPQPDGSFCSTKRNKSCLTFIARVCLNSMVFQDEVFWLHPGFPGSAKVIQFVTETRRDEKRRAEDGIEFSESSTRSRPRCGRGRRPRQIQESGCSSFCLFSLPPTIVWAILDGRFGLEMSLRRFPSQFVATRFPSPC